MAQGGGPEGNGRDDPRILRLRRADGELRGACRVDWLGYLRRRMTPAAAGMAVMAWKIVVARLATGLDQRAAADLKKNSRELNKSTTAI